MLPAQVMLWLAGAGLCFYVLTFYIATDSVGMDTHAYWVAAHTPQPVYDGAPGTRDAFLYSPAFQQLLHPLRWVPWPVFCLFWISMETAALGWLVAPLGWKWAVPCLLLLTPEIVIGNVLGMLGVAVVLGFRFPSAWAAVALTKPAFGLGPIWFLARGQWRSLTVSVAATITVVTGSILVGGLDPWIRWLDFLVGHTGVASTLGLRLALAVVLTIVAGRADVPWLLGPALVLATPAPGGSAFLAILATIPRLAAMPRSYGRRAGGSWSGQLRLIAPAARTQPRS